MPRKVQTSPGPGPMETIVIEDLETGQQAQHETGLEEQPPPEEAEEDAAMYEAVLQASYRTKKKQKRIKSLIEHTKAKKQKGLWQGPPQPGASWNGTRELQCQWKTLQGQRQWKTKCHPTMAPGSIQPLEPVPVEAIPTQKEVELKLEVQQKIHGAADSSSLEKKLQSC